MTIDILVVNRKFIVWHSFPNLGSGAGSFTWKLICPRICCINWALSYPKTNGLASLNNTAAEHWAGESFHFVLY